ncbi:MAG: hypothetical protein QN193_09010 [Armatimonadota bacterium]|nr:hypothetical protein [Armatimonadota bacterium]MDR7444375.1 hypothetical protein [Armatimonadota bacterium]MDR7570732.1 hypothetical protein [Armatimonadota bacterium]MDR7614862.1 hypothetical protein [Armatimonadota bacterium]
MSPKPLPTLVLAVALALGVLSAAGAEDPPLERPTWRVGDRWVFQADGPPGKARVTDTVKRVGSYEGRPAYFLERVTELLDGSRRWVFTVVFDLDLNFLARFDERGRLLNKITWQYFRWPRRPGDSYESEYTYQDRLEDGTWDVGRGRLHVWVFGWEVIETPAGRLRALRQHVIFRDYDLRGQAIGHALEDSWVSPDARWLVRGRYKNYTTGDWDEYELVEFQPAR